METWSERQDRMHREVAEAIAAAVAGDHGKLVEMIYELRFGMSDLDDLDDRVNRLENAMGYPNA